MGPTASGKTDLAIKLSAVIDTHIISVDSAMIYRGMDIGTAKPDSQELSQAPHSLIDIRDPNQAYSVSEFIEDAKSEVNKAHQQDKLAILVGGTMLYHKALLDGIADLPSSNLENRSLLESLAAEHGLESLHKQLSELDPIIASKINSNDPQRIMRALDVIWQTGVPFSTLQTKNESAAAAQWNHYVVQLLPDPRHMLHQKIEKRFKQMIAQGFIDEVKILLNTPNLSKDSPGLKAVGYKQAVEHLESKVSLAEMQELGIIATRQFAKRQFTWLRGLKNDTNFNPFDANYQTLAIDKIQQWYELSKKSFNQQ